MPNVKPVAPWASPVSEFLMRHLPRAALHGADEWDHMAISAYELSCAALVTFGIAETTPGGGARRLERPRSGLSGPRWDDICLVVLSMADQAGKLNYRDRDDQRAPEHRVPGERWPAPNLRSAHGLGQAWASDDAIAVLTCLGLIRNRSWTAQAQQVLWREQPREWPQDIANDPRFLAAVDHAVMHMPDDIRAAMHWLVSLADRDRRLMRSEASEPGSLAAASGFMTALRVLAPNLDRTALRFVARHEPDRMFFTYWRRPDGWLDIDAGETALPINHDPLAILVRQHAIRLIWPEKPEMAT